MYKNELNEQIEKLFLKKYIQSNQKVCRHEQGGAGDVIGPV